MVRQLLRRTVASFERKWNYDASYLKEIVDLSPLAAWKFALATRLGGYRRDVPPPGPVCSWNHRRALRSRRGRDGKRPGPDDDALRHSGRPPLTLDARAPV